MSTSGSVFFIFLGGPEFQEFPGEQTSPSLLLKKKKKPKQKNNGGRKEQILNNFLLFSVRFRKRKICYNYIQAFPLDYLDLFFSFLSLRLIAAIPPLHEMKVCVAQSW